MGTPEDEINEIEQIVETLLVDLPPDELFKLARMLDKLRRRAFYEHYLKFPRKQVPYDPRRFKI
jgi:hypothetical protein